ncbi:MAG TPA: hypothetical protein VIE66_03255 [Methylocella sp.]
MDQFLAVMLQVLVRPRLKTGHDKLLERYCAFDRAIDGSKPGFFVRNCRLGRIHA